MPRFAIVVAADEAGGIGKNGQLPWHLKGDMTYFRRLTTEAAAGKCNAVIMGRKTWDSIPEKFRPLRDRINLVVSRSPAVSLPEDVMRADGLDAALARLEATIGVGRVFVIGGGQIYRDAVEHRDLEAIYLTRVRGDMNCDTFFPGIPPRFELASQSDAQSEGGLTYDFRVFRQFDD